VFQSKYFNTLDLSAGKQNQLNAKLASEILMR